MCSSRGYVVSSGCAAPQVCRLARLPKASSLVDGVDLAAAEDVIRRFRRGGNWRNDRGRDKGQGRQQTFDMHELETIYSNLVLS